MSNAQKLDEFGWIARHAQQLGVRAGVRVGLGDDAAVLETLSAPVVTCDCLVENVHFRRDWTSPRDLGRKSLSVSVSDIAAMGAQPVAAFVSLAIPADCDPNFWDEFYGGMEEIAACFSFSVAGGDTSRSPNGLFINVTLVGECRAPNAAPVLRSGAQVGDVLIVTGTLGDSAAGLWTLQALSERDENGREVLRRHFDPTARLIEMNAALEIGGVRAALDLSDGLAGDAAHIARASQLSLQIEINKLPISDACRAVAELAQTASKEHRVLDIAQTWALSGGEDYELLLCVAPECAEQTRCRIEVQTGTRATVIGQCVESGKGEDRVILRDGKNQEVALPSAWTHF